MPVASEMLTGFAQLHAVVCLQLLQFALLREHPLFQGLDVHSDDVVEEEVIGAEILRAMGPEASKCLVSLYG